MRKFLSILVAALLCLSIIGCKKPGKEDGIVLTYAAWNLGSENSETPNMERMMLDAFEEAHPGITVEVVERPKVPGTDGDQAWNEFLGAKASVGQLPDVFMADNIPYYVINDWAYNLTTIANADDEYKAISSDITGTVTYDGKVMALPSAVHYMGYVVNKSLYTSRGQTAPTVNTTMEQLLASTKAAADHANTQKRGIVGFEGIEHILHWYPAQLNSDLEWFTFDGEKFNLDGAEFTAAVELYRELQTSPEYVLEALQWESNQENTNVILTDIFASNDYFNSGIILCKWFYTYDFGWMQQKIDDGDYTWNLDFIGTPVVNGNKQVPSVIDFLTVAKTTQHPEEAYELAKWMGYGKEGYLKRIELSNTVEGISKVNFAPIQSDQELMDAYFDIYPSFTGLRAIIEAGNFVVEPPKFQVGYDKVRYNGTYDADNKMGDIVNKLMAGEVRIADIKKAFNDKANQLYEAEKATFYAELAKR